MKKRQLSKDFLDDLKGNKYPNLLNEVINDDTLDMELRGDSVIVYYRGGKIVELNEKGILSPLDPQYGTVNILNMNNIVDYFKEAKHLIDIYQTGTKNNLGEKEISQRIVMENNYSPYSYDTDYFIIDMEYNDGYQFDLVALKWPSTSTAHKNKQCGISIIETKQGYSTLRTIGKNPGICKHYEDFINFTNNDSDIKDFCSDMLMVFKQKCELGLIKGISRLKIDRNTQFDLTQPIEFIVVLANYKGASTNLMNELDKLNAKYPSNECKFATSSFMGYGLFDEYIMKTNDFRTRYNI